MITKKLDIKHLEKHLGKMSLGRFIRILRQADGVSQVEFALKLGISKAKLCDIERERKAVSPERASKFTKILKVPEQALVQLAIQDLLAC